MAGRKTTKSAGQTYWTEPQAVAFIRAVLEAFPGTQVLAPGGPPRVDCRPPASDGD